MSLASASFKGPIKPPRRAPRQRRAFGAPWPLLARHAIWFEGPSFATVRGHAQGTSLRGRSRGTGCRVTVQATAEKPPSKRPSHRARLRDRHRDCVKEVSKGPPKRPSEAAQRIRPSEYASDPPSDPPSDCSGWPFRGAVSSCHFEGPSEGAVSRAVSRVFSRVCLGGRFEGPFLRGRLFGAASRSRLGEPFRMAVSGRRGNGAVAGGRLAAPSRGAGERRSDGPALHPAGLRGWCFLPTR